MTIKKFDQTQKEQLLQMVAEEFPIFVLGPGCYRVGFDNPENPGWREIERRVADLLSRLDGEERLFMREFFFSKLSDEHRAGPDREAAADRLDGLVVAAERRWDEERKVAAGNDSDARDRSAQAMQTFDPWRTLLATEILQAFRHASCCLGLTIGNGLSPVLLWQEAMVPVEAIAGWSKDTTDLDGFGTAVDRLDDRGAEYHFRASRRAIRSACVLTRALHDLSEENRIGRQQVGAMAGILLPDDVNLEVSVPDALVRVLKGPLEVLLPLRMVAVLDVLDDRCFTGRFEALRGANVEWLGDLLWHVLSSDAEVQPSQAELAFYVTLSEQRPPQVHDLRRPAYGDRAAGDFDLTRLTNRSQPEGASANHDVDSVLRTIAACLHAQHRMVMYADGLRKGAEERMRAGFSGVYTAEEQQVVRRTMDLQVLALVEDYGDTLEQALFDLLDIEGRFHVAVPAWLKTERGRKIDWLLATIVKKGADEPTVEWRWLAEAEKAVGPIVIKLNGCDRPLLGVQPLRGLVSQLTIVSATSRHNEASMELAIIYDEHDRLTAMQTFDELIGDPTSTSGLVSALNTHDKGLSWQGRTWIILGQRFADWIPRLSLFTRRWAGAKDTKTPTPTNYWAIDRSFDWPERSLLESLDISMIEGELGAVAKTLTGTAALDDRRSSIGQQYGALFGQVAGR